jgi:hypothetical protein
MFCYLHYSVVLLFGETVRQRCFVICITPLFCDLHCSVVLGCALMLFCDLYYETQSHIFVITCASANALQKVFLCTEYTIASVAISTVTCLFLL